MQTQLALELRSTATLSASQLIAANVNGPTRSAPLRSTLRTHRQPTLDKIQETFEVAEQKRAADQIGTPPASDADAKPSLLSRALLLSVLVPKIVLE